MGRDAISKLIEAKELDKLADGIRKRDPVNASRMDAAAKRKRASAVKQLARRPGKKGQKAGRTVL
jgi:hypothetical protein